MYLTPTNLHWACDIEADNLKESATVIWCATLINLVTKEKVKCLTASEFATFRHDNPKAIFVGHNFVAYDAPMLNKFWRAGIGIKDIVDTFVLSQMYNPNYPGGHGLAIWGKRLRYPKGEFNDFSKYSDEMLEYCMRDTILTALLFKRLSERMRQYKFTEMGAEIEHKAWNIIQNRQKTHGFPFNYKEGHLLYVELRRIEEELKREIYQLWPPQLLPAKRYSKAYKKNREATKDYERHIGQYPKVEIHDDGGYTTYDYVAFNLGSPIQRIAKLLELGWKPVNKTKKGNPKVDEDELLAFAELSGKPEVGKLARWIVINSRANMLNGWLEAYNEKTGAIHGNLFIASTLRYKHSSPNSANIPAVRLKDVDGKDVIQYGADGAWTYECRDLWTCGDPGEFVLVGIDGTGIQNRCLIHNLIKTVGEDAVKDFKELALAGDVHKRNIEVLGLKNKAAAKKFYYTLMMGGQGARLAADQAQFGTFLTAKEGQEKRDKMIASIPGFGTLIDNLQTQLKTTGRITLCDGTPVLVPLPHMVIPYLLQGDESRLMKQALIYVFEELVKNGLLKHVFKVADIHDEWQFQVRRKYVDDFISMALPCFSRSGDYFNYLIPIDGDAKVGLTWAETH